MRRANAVQIFVTVLPGFSGILFVCVAGGSITNNISGLNDNYRRNQ
jgi:hypothetical protein